ncbi:hypothetical protein EON63_11175, partial [archaeon]
MTDNIPLDGTLTFLSLKLFKDVMIGTSPLPTLIKARTVVFDGPSEILTMLQSKLHSVLDNDHIENASLPIRNTRITGLGGVQPMKGGWLLKKRDIMGGEITCMSMGMPLDIHITLTYIHTYTYVHIHTQFSRIYPHIHMFKHTHIYIRICYIPIPLRIYTLYVSIRIHSHTHTYTQTHTYTYRMEVSLLRSLPRQTRILLRPLPSQSRHT